ncbi:DUF6415 family natural product biosynthesis protein [Streptomyces sp. NPDC054786]
MIARANRGATQRLAPAPPIGAETIRATICLAVRLGTGNPGLPELAAVQKRLQGHIALLLPLVREEVARLPQDSVLAHQATARLTGIEEQARQPLLPDTLAAHSQVGTTARDCRYLLAMHTSAARP